jgi:hypothetical protein
LTAIAAGERSITHGCGFLLKERRNTSPGTKWTVAKKPMDETAFTATQAGHFLLQF